MILLEIHNYSHIIKYLFAVVVASAAGVAAMVEDVFAATAAAVAAAASKKLFHFNIFIAFAVNLVQCQCFLENSPTQRSASVLVCASPIRRKWPRQAHVHFDKRTDGRTD